MPGRDDVVVIGAGPAGLLAAWLAAAQGLRVRILASGIGSTHISPGWIHVLDTDAGLQAALEGWIAAHPGHPYAAAGLDALQGGISALRDICAQAGLAYVGDLEGNFRLPTALGALVPAALVPESFAAGDARLPGAMLIAGPDGWRDFYPGLCAANLARRGIRAGSATFSLPEGAKGKFDLTAVGLARLFEQAEVRARVAHALKPRLEGATRVGFPAVLGLEHHPEAWRDLQDRLGVQVFEIPTLPPCVPGIRLYGALKAALARSGVRILLDMTATAGQTEGRRAAAVVVSQAARHASYRAERFILATGGLYGGGITTDRWGTMREVVFNLPLHVPGEAGGWFMERFLTEQGHPIHRAGVRVNERMQPTDETGDILLDNVHIAGRLVAGYDPTIEGSGEGVILATAFRAAGT